jgi:Pregnancy-associated plasma protein-A/Secretion system C-terminal sorting domain/Fibronectin type III domain
MKKQITLILALLVMFCSSSLAQTSCGLEPLRQRELSIDSKTQARLDAYEQTITKYLESNPVGERSVLTIPVVFHVLWNTSTQNISDAQIHSQLAALNNDFRALNSDVSQVPPLFAGLVADCQINFCLATRSPSGVTTNGITRRSCLVTNWMSPGPGNSLTSFTENGIDAWNTTKYLNIYVCSLGGNVIGFAGSPGLFPASRDVVVLDYRYTGTIGTAVSNYNRGHTASHEVGHWLALEHIWGDGVCASDKVADTPNHDANNFGCPTFPHLSTCAGTPVEMTMNYMDYTIDLCKSMFTHGQKARMRAALATSRASLFTNNLACTPGAPPANTCNIPTGLFVTDITATQVTLNWPPALGAERYYLQYRKDNQGQYTSLLLPFTNSFKLTGLSPQTQYAWRIHSHCYAGISQGSVHNLFTTASSTCSDNYESNNTSATAKLVPPNTDIFAKIGVPGDLDHFSFKLTTAVPQLDIHVTDLTHGFQISVYRDRTLYYVMGTLSPGVTTGLISVPNPALGDYVVKIEGLNGGSSLEKCYKLRVNMDVMMLSDQPGYIDADNRPLPHLNEKVFTDFEMWPNPANESVTVELQSAIDSESHITLIDVSGRQLRNIWVPVFEAQMNQVDLDTNDLPVGVYFVQVSNNGHVATKKLIIQHE